ncbi:MAG TPA: hypothetical protein PKD53_11595 [Chloroflexaceae bacterium]|nr:hypothetical protein [Chloroflexaceae bacterium]
MILARRDVIAKLEDRLAGLIDDQGLAAWAFDSYYAIEQGTLSVAPDDADPLAEALDDLMFADEPSFALGEADLRRLIARLQGP